MTDFASIDFERSLDDQIVFRGFTRRDLKEAFDSAVAPGANWKDPIVTIVPNDGDLDLVVAGIEFMVGGPTTVVARTFCRRGEDVTVRVVSNAGYYANIGA